MKISENGISPIAHRVMVLGLSTNRQSIVHVISVTTLASFLTGVNARLAVVGIPTIAQALSTSITGVVWIIQGYMLGSTFIQTIIGRLADLHGRVKLFNIGFIIFTLGALATGFSTNSIEVVLSRILQGIGGAFLMALSVTILTDNVSSNMLATWLGVNQIAWRVGALVGLTLSGLIIDYMGWRWLFLIQIPIGIAAYIWSKLILRDVYKPVEKPIMDWKGFSTFITSITLILIALTLLAYGFEFTMLGNILLIIGVLLLAIFIIIELRVLSPLIDLKLFKVWQFTGGIIAQALHSIAFGASITLLSIYLQNVREFSASVTGLIFLPFELSFLIAGVTGGRLSDLYGYVPITIAGLLTAGTSLYVLSMLTSTIESDISTLLIAIAFLGIGAGLFIAPNTSSIMASVPPYRRGVASSIRMIFANIGFMVSLNIAILIITMHIPYSIASKILIHIDISGVQIENIVNEFAYGIGTSFKTQAIIMFIAIPFSLTRLRYKHKAEYQ